MRELGIALLFVVAAGFVVQTADTKDWRVGLFHHSHRETFP